MRENGAKGLPSGWVWTTLGEVTEPTVDQSGPNGIGDFLYVDISSINNKAKKIVSPKSVPVAQAPSRARQHLRVGDVVVSMTRPNLNAVAMVPVNMEHAIGSTGLHVLRTNVVHPSWLYYLVQTETFISAMSGLVLGVLYPAVRPKDIRSYTIPLAPRTEQHHIVAEIEKQFTRLDAGVAALERARANLKRYRASVLKAACEGRLVPTEAELARAEGRDYEPADRLLARILKERRAKWEADQLAKMQAQDKVPKDDKWKKKYQEPVGPDTTDLPELPERWVWASLEQIAEIQGGIQKQPKRAPAKNAFPFLRVANVFRGKLDLSEIHKIELFGDELEKLRLYPGDLLIVEGNGSPSEIGRMAIWNGTIQDCVHQNHLIRARLLGDISPHYAASYWNSPDGAARVLQVASSTSGLYTLSVTKVGSLLIPLPPTAEQHSIVAEVERRLSVIDELEAIVAANLKRAERLRQSILKRAFEGKLVPQDPNDEPAGVLLERIRAERQVELKATAKAISKPSQKSKRPQVAETQAELFR